MTVTYCGARCGCGATIALTVKELGQTTDGLHRQMLEGLHSVPLCEAWTKGSVALVPLLAAAEAAGATP